MSALGNIHRILVANRGEIACRILSTCHRLGVRTVAVFSDADRGALHVRLADAAVHIGGSSPAESYLNIPAIIDAALSTGAQAIHPGYGFLSENAAFARACDAAGLTFVGPGVAAIEAMAVKDSAKAIMHAAGVPVVPGYAGDDQSPGTLHREAAAIGYPLLVKAVAGGGGRGMRVVRGAAGLEEGLIGAMREARKAFGDDRVMLEKYLERSRHVEVQVLGDTHGGLVHLYERDCSLQRRHQKIVEEAPAAGITDEFRQRIGDAAVRAARAVDYVGAGTVEFIVDPDGNHYFMEMNTRLQVEHPVTEMITGIDLVEWQLRVADGQRLPWRQEQVTFTGHAIEARLYAETPEAGFLPSSGRLHHLEFPPADARIRIDTGVAGGDQVSVHYDPMIAKLIVHGADRSAAIALLQTALRSTGILGVSSNLAFLRRIAEHPLFLGARIHTSLLDEALGEFLDVSTGIPQAALIAAAAIDRNHVESRLVPGPEREAGCGWRLNGDALHEVRFRAGDEIVTVHSKRAGHDLEFRTGAGTCRVADLACSETGMACLLNGTRFRCSGVRDAQGIELLLEGRRYLLPFDTVDAAVVAGAGDTATGILLAPMPGSVVAVSVGVGDVVEAGTAIIVIEAMKMEHTLVAPFAGEVVEIACQAGTQTPGGAVLARIAPRASGASS